MVLDGEEYNSGSNRASDFKSAEREEWGWFEITSTIAPELYDTNYCYYYQLIISITKFNGWKMAAQI